MDVEDDSKDDDEYTLDDEADSSDVQVQNVNTWSSKEYLNTSQRLATLCTLSPELKNEVIKFGEGCQNR